MRICESFKTCNHKKMSLMARSKSLPKTIVYMTTMYDSL